METLTTHIRGKLRNYKYTYALFSWMVDELGQASLTKDKKYNLHITNSQTNQITLYKEQPN
jgi:hypothetical protein